MFHDIDQRLNVCLIRDHLQNMSVEVGGFDMSGDTWDSLPLH